MPSFNRLTLRYGLLLSLSSESSNFWSLSPSSLQTHITHAARYERQLWDTGWENRSGKGRGSDGGLVTLHGGTIGVFVLDMGDGINDERMSAAGVLDSGY